MSERCWVRVTACDNIPLREGRAVDRGRPRDRHFQSGRSLSRGRQPVPAQGRPAGRRHRRGRGGRVSAARLEGETSRPGRSSGRPKPGGVRRASRRASKTASVFDELDPFLIGSYGLEAPMPRESFQGLRVLAFESRRAGELATLRSRRSGDIRSTAPAVREVPLESNAGVLAFAATLLAGGFDAVVFLLPALAPAPSSRRLEPRYPAEAIVAALSRTKVIARGPKPVAVLREWQVPVWLIAPEPNTWQALADAIDARAAEWSLGRGACGRAGVQRAERRPGRGARRARRRRHPRPGVPLGVARGRGAPEARRHRHRGG